MPQAKAKNPRKPVKFTTYKYNYGVKECLHWPDPSAKPQPIPPGVVTHKMIPKKGEVGKPLDRGFDLSGLGNNLPRNPEDDDHVIDALRGWPGNRRSEIEEGMVRTEEEEYGLYRKTAIELEAEQRKSSKKSTKKKKSGAKKSHRSRGLEGGDGPDPHMGDLISHRFMIEAARARQQQREEERRAEKERRRMEYERKFPKDIKATKASQLRSIAQAEKVGADGKLWQMSKFQKVPSHLDTFRGSAKSSESDPYRYSGASPRRQDYGGSDMGYALENDREPELNFTSDVQEYGTLDKTLGAEPFNTVIQEEVAF